MFDSLWQSITKCDRYYYKMRQKFFTKYVRFFLTKCDSYYKLRHYNSKLNSLDCRTSLQLYSWFYLTHFSPVLHFYTPWKVRKPKLSRRVQGVSKCGTGLKWVNIQLLKDPLTSGWVRAIQKIRRLGHGG